MPHDSETETMRHSDDEADLSDESGWSRLLSWSLQPRILGTVVLAGLFVVVIPAIPSLWPSVSQRTKFPMSADRIDLTAATSWAPHDLVARVAADHPGWNERSLLDATLAADLAVAFAKNPWIEKVDRVEKTRQGRVVIQVTYRTPVAMVQTIRGLYPIDAQGVLLPPQDFSLAESNQLPLIRQVKSLPNGNAGQPWGDPIVVAGAKLCAALTPQGTLDSPWNSYELEAVIAPVSHQGSRLPSDAPASHPAPLVFGLVTKDGRHIIWGQAPGDDSLEPTVAQKLGRLQKWTSTDLPEDGKGVDLRPFDSMPRISLEEFNTAVMR